MSALRIVLLTVPRVSRSCDHLNEFDHHLLPNPTTRAQLPDKITRLVNLLDVHLNVNFLGDAPPEIE